MGIGDSIRGVMSNALGMDKVTTALGGAPAAKAQTGSFPPRPANNGHTTSGLDQAMQDHADKMHPVSKPVYGADWDK